MDEDVQSNRTLFDITVVPFEPLTTGDGKAISEKHDRLRKAILERLSEKELDKSREVLREKLVTVTVAFFLWKGSSKTTNTRPVKDLDNLLKILFDVLGKREQGLGLLDEDSYVCEVYAKKELVDDEAEEGYRVIIEEYEDEEMLRLLKKFYSNELASGPDSKM